MHKWAIFVAFLTFLRIKNKNTDAVYQKTLQSFILPVTIIYIYYFFIMTPEAERFNGWAAMLGFVAAVGAYVTTGQIIPGWF